MSENEKTFEEKLSVLTELSKSGIVSIVNLKYANPEQYLINFATLWDFARETNVLFNCYNVPSKGKPTISNDVWEEPILGLQRYGVDTITPIKYTPTREQVLRLQNQEPPSTIEEINFDWSYHPADAVLSKIHWIKLPSNSVECRCKLCKKRTQDDLIQKFAYNDLGELMPLSMKYTSELHSAFSYGLQFDRIRSHIKSNEMENYHQEVADYRNSHLIV